MPVRRGGPRSIGLRRAGAVLAALLLASACGGTDGARRERPPGAAIWVDPAVAALDSGTARTLRAGGVEEVFLVAADLDGGGGEPRLAHRRGALRDGVPTATSVTLVVNVPWPLPAAWEAVGVGESLGRAAEALRSAADAAGLLPVGIHLHLTAAETSPGTGSEPGSAANGGTAAPAAPLPIATDALAELLEGLRRTLPPDLLLSAGLPHPWLAADGWGAVARRVDFLVPWLYGAPPGGGAGPEAWDPERVVADARRLAEAGTELLVGLRVVGGVERLDRSGGVSEVTTRAELAPIARDRALRPATANDDSLAGVGRLVYTFQAQRRTRVAGWTLAPGERVRVVRTAPSILHDLRRRLSDATGERLGGVLFHRLPASAEGLTPAPASLSASLASETPTPRLDGTVVVESKNSRTAILGAALENLSPFGTDLGFSEGNYLAIRTDGAIIGRVEPGEFSRYSLWREGREVQPGLGWREPDEVRLHTPVVTGGARIGGARVELVAERGRRASEPTVELTGRFYLADGRELELAPQRGKLDQMGRSEGPGAGAALSNAGGGGQGRSRDATLE